MKKKNRVVLYAMAFLIILLVIYLVFNYITNYHKNTIINNSDNNNQVNGINIDDRLAIYNNYVYFLPDGCLYGIKNTDDNNLLYIYNSEQKWEALISLVDKEKMEENIFNDYVKLENVLRDSANNSEIKNRKVVENNGNEIISFEVYGSENNNLLAYMDAYDNNEYQINIIDSDNKLINYNALDVIADMLSNGRKIEDNKGKTTE